ncbi:hypothetical protein N7494_000491 [Penicillium frequentans]|uniref:NADH:flavin oxidoreductase/NADH oxidase N-terminal domain-containing protein n=1 Tax=Penicillium frequentans TaxID=3151616 RepID=A0AAD6GJV2_9EURO|nr:hypothetical protein N7494_000491 [Penicillium glabrum]
MPSILESPVRLPCGLVLPNRLSKSAMAEQISPDNQPTEAVFKIYEQWAQGGWGSMITGNVQVDVNHLGSPFDIAIPDEDPKSEASISQWIKYAEVCQRNGTPTIVQICHPGRQSFRTAGRRGRLAHTLAPSAVPMNLGSGVLDRVFSTIAWATPKEMTHFEVKHVVEQFVSAASLISTAGFSGVQLHAAHGYLIDQFLNEKTNLRSDEYGGSAEQRAQFSLEILARTREVVPATFCVGIKFNSADRESSHFEDTMTQIKLLVDAGIDFMEISGGSQEDPRMMTGQAATTLQKSERTLAREAFFHEFANEVRHRHPQLVLMLTGGFRTRSGAQAAVEKNVCDIVGMGRPAIINNHLPLTFFNDKATEDEASVPLGNAPRPFYAALLPKNIAGAGAESVGDILQLFMRLLTPKQKYYAEQMQRLAKGLPAHAPQC